MRPFIKVDRVGSLKEAQDLDRAGVGIVGVSLIEDSRFSDERIISLGVAMEISASLKNAKFCGEINLEDWSSSDFLPMVKQLGFDYVQISGSRIPGIAFQKKLDALDVGIIFAGIEVSYEDDPSWILSRFPSDEGMKASFFQLDLLPDMENSWEFLCKECPKYPEELQVEEINDLAKKNPLIITTDVSKGNINEVANRLSFVQGISMTLGSRPRREDIHYFGFDEVFRILGHIRPYPSLLG